MAFAVGCVTVRVGGAEEGYRGGPHCRGQMQRTGICADKYRAARHEGGELHQCRGWGDRWRVRHGLHHALHEGFLARSPGEQSPDLITADQGTSLSPAVEWPPPP